MATVSTTTLNSANGTTDLTITTGNTTTGGLVLYANGFGMSLKSNSTTNAVAISATGNVGIGTATPTFKFVAVGGGTQISGGNSSQAGLRIQTSSGFSTITGINLDNNAFNPLAIYTSASEAMRIDTGANVGISTTDTSNAKLTVNGYFSVYQTVENSTIPTLRSVLVRKSTDDSLLAIGYTSVNDSWNVTASYGSTGAFKPIAVYTSDTERFRISTAGDIYINTSTLWQYQPANTGKTAAAVLTAAELKTGIITYVGAAATLNMPAATAIDAGWTGIPTTNIGFDFYVINTGAAANTATIGTNTNVTTVGSMAVAGATSGHFRVRRSAATPAYVVYRLS